MKKIISLLLVILICSSSILPVFAADSNAYTQNSILVDYDGIELYLDVFVSDDTILIPADILTWFGGLNRRTENSEYIYSQSTSSDPYEFDREIRISKSGSYGKSVIKIKQEQSVPGVSVNFKDSYIYEETLYIPLEEIVPFLDAKIEITQDGILHIYPTPVSIFEALSYGDLNDLLDSNYDDDDYNVLFDISDGSGTAGLSMFVDTIMGRLDRLDFIFDSGTIKDYKKLYEKMLVQNDTYLAAFDEKETPYDKALTTIKKHLNEGNEHFDFVDGVLKKTEKVLKYAVGSEKFKNYQNFSDSVDSFSLDAELMDGIYKAANYADVLYKMVDDHHEMLYVVYENGNAKSTPAGKAANEIADLYGENTGKKIKSLCVSTLRDYIADEIKDYLTKPIKPYLIVCNAIKDIIPGDLSEDYDQIYLDTIVADSREAFVDYYNNMSFNTESLNDLRLSLLMAMLSSKYGYDISSMFDATDYPDSIRSKKRITVDNWLEKLYFAADSAECSTPEYYNKMKKELSADIKYLKVDSNTTPDTPDTPISPEPPITPDPPVTPNPPVTPDAPAEDPNDDSIYADKFSDVASTPTMYVSGVESVYFRKAPNTASDGILTLKKGDSVIVCKIGVVDGEKWAYAVVETGPTKPGDGPTYRYGYLSYNCLSYNKGESTDNATSVGLKFTLNSDGKSYSVTGIGTCPDREIVIPTKYNGLSVTSIGTVAFSVCSSLTSITIPDSVISIGYGAFAYCSSLESIIVDSGNATYHSDGNCLIETASKTLISGCKNSIIPTDGSVTSIGSYAFYSCSSLESITLPDSVTSIGYEAFYGCSGLTSITISDSVISIGYGAFLDCSSLTSITIPDSVTSIGDSAFAYCSSLTSITLPDSVTTLGKDAFLDCTKLLEVTLGTSLRDIGSEAFRNCSSLTSITIPDGVTSIGEGAFWGCSSLTSIVVDSGNTIYHSDGNCLIETASKTLISGCKNSIIPTDGSVTSIGYLAFAGCSNLTSITIPDSVTSIGYSAFYDCSSLTSITYEGTVAQWNAISKGDWWHLDVPATQVICSDGVVKLN